MTHLLEKNIQKKLKKKISETLKLLKLKNSQLGTQWITNGEINKKIKIDNVIPTGWNLGRIIKK